MLIRQLIIIFIVLLSYPEFLQSQTIKDSTKKFEIVYLAAGKYASNPVWLKKIRDDWKATAINLRIYRFAVEGADSNLNWNNYPYEVDSAMTEIAHAKMNIYLRVNFAILTNQQIKSYRDDDFHIRSNREKFLNVYRREPLLNVTSRKSRGDMLNFLSKVVMHLNTLSSRVRSRIKLIVPTLSQDDETEFPFATYDKETNRDIFDVLTGFSRPEMAAFMRFLSNRYITIDSLNESWGEGANFSSFDTNQIRIRDYNWDGVKTDPNSKDYYRFVNGRKDFLDFRIEELKKFLDDCSVIVRKAGYKFGVQFGSIYDNLTEFRGFYDPTSLIQNVDMVITDDILEYYPNYDFSADYSRSLCKYWVWKDKASNSINFSTETNWPGYGGFTPPELIKYWSLQLRTFYEKGASCLFLSHWGTVDSPEKIPQKVISGSLLPDYKPWQDTLAEFRDAHVRIVNNTFAFNLSCEQGINNETLLLIPVFAHNKGLTIGNLSGRGIIEFPLNNFSRIKANNGSKAYNDNGDFVTDFMIQNSPDYIKENYKSFYLTRTSRFMTDSIKNKFIQSK